MAAYLRKVAETVNDLDNVLYEVAKLKVERKTGSVMVVYCTSTRRRRRNSICSGRNRPRSEEQRRKMHASPATGPRLASKDGWTEKDGSIYRFETYQNQSCSTWIMCRVGDEIWVWRSSWQGRRLFMDPDDDPNWELIPTNQGVGVGRC